MLVPRHLEGLAAQQHVRQESRTKDWSGPDDDPDCPYNWPEWKRIYMTSIPAFLCINVSACSSISNADNRF